MRSIASAVLFVIILANVPSAYAHEHRNVTIANQQVQFTVGWIVEPAYVDQQNSVDFRVALAASGSPVVGLEKILQVEVSTGSNQMVLSLEPVFRKPGAYGADVIPTVPGSYAFRFFGNVNGTSVNERFVCGPTTFDCVTDVAVFNFLRRRLLVELFSLVFKVCSHRFPTSECPHVGVCDRSQWNYRWHNWFSCGCYCSQAWEEN